MTHAIPAEADWDAAPGLLDGAKELTLTAAQCDLAYWLEAVAQGTLRGRAATGHAPDAATPDFMRRPGPLREALVLELGYRSIAEEKATRLLAYYVAHAPGVAELEFYATQLIDEARHAKVFRHHLVELGMPADGLVRAVEEMAAEYVREVLDPIEAFATRVVRDERDFVGGVAIFTIIIEGVLAPAAELSERKWTPLDPAASEIARGASIDEIRHLTVGSSIIREHLARCPEYRPRLLDILREGRRLWDELPDAKYVLHREELFQEGMAQQAARIGDYEIWPGRRLLDTTPQERYAAAERWTEEMAEARMRYMGLEDGLAILAGPAEPA
ncbi:MAG TPA: VlmB-like protein [Pilimelia sp.]|nr:VlmB-like protein [Pilimelia sp.]